MLATHRHCLLLTGTPEAIGLRVYGNNPLLLLGPNDVELLIAELMEWRDEHAEATAVSLRGAEYLHGKVVVNQHQATVSRPFHRRSRNLAVHGDSRRRSVWMEPLGNSEGRTSEDLRSVRGQSRKVVPEIG